EHAQVTTRLLAALLALVACAAHASPDCTPATLAHDAAPLGAIRARLAAVAVSEDTDVPIEARADLDALKDEGANVVARAVACLPVGRPPTPAEIQQALARLVPTTPNASYASDLQFEASQGTDARRLLFVVTRIDIPCGQDAVLSVFEPRGGRYRERLRWH